MAKRPQQLGVDLFKTAQTISKIPTDQVMGLARITKAQIESDQPRGTPRIRDNYKSKTGRTSTGSSLHIKKPRQKMGKAWTIVAGSAFAVIAEHGSYNRPDGWTIYPKAYTVAGGATTFGNVRYLGRSRIDSTRAKLAREAAGDRVRVSARDKDRIKHLVLAFGQTGFMRTDGKAFARRSFHKPIPAGRFMERSAQRAQDRSGQIVAEKVLKATRQFR